MGIRRERGCTPQRKSVLEGKENYAEETVGKCDPYQADVRPIEVGSQHLLAAALPLITQHAVSQERVLLYIGKHQDRLKQPCVGGTIGSRRSRRNNRECICEFCSSARYQLGTDNHDRRQTKNCQRYKDKEGRHKLTDSPPSKQKEQEGQSHADCQPTLC